jgi:hypothetical protein
MARRSSAGALAQAVVAAECNADVAAAADVAFGCESTSNQEAELVGEVRTQLSALRARDAELLAVIARATAEREVVRTKMASAEGRLNVLVNAPVSRGRNPTEWLPDELVVMVLLMLPFETLRGGACQRVCRRWARLMESTPVKRRMRDGRWAAYEDGVIEPHALEPMHDDRVIALAVGLDGKVYSGSEDRTVRVWTSKGEHIGHHMTLEGHTSHVEALAVGLDGKVYSGSADRTIRVWSGDDGTFLRTLEGHTSAVYALAVGLDGKIFSGSRDATVRVWSGDDGAHLQTLKGHANLITALAVGVDGKIYSGSYDKTIRAWSGQDGTHLRTLVGHNRGVNALVVGPDGRVYSGAWREIWVWSGKDGAHLQTLTGHTDSVRALAVWGDGKLFSGSVESGKIRVWSSNGAHLHTLTGHEAGVYALALKPDGTLFSGGSHVLHDYHGDDDHEVGDVAVW